jgi:hypothetical protein
MSEKDKKVKIPMEQELFLRNYEAYYGHDLALKMRQIMEKKVLDAERAEEEKTEEEMIEDENQQSNVEESQIATTIIDKLEQLKMEILESKAPDENIIHTKQGNWVQLPDNVDPSEFLSFVKKMDFLFSKVQNFKNFKGLHVAIVRTESGMILEIIGEIYINSNDKILSEENLLREISENNLTKAGKLYEKNRKLLEDEKKKAEESAE